MNLIGKSAPRKEGRKKVTVLHEGRVLCEGSVSDVQSDPRVQEVYLGRNKSHAAAEAV